MLWIKEFGSPQRQGGPYGRASLYPVPPVVWLRETADI
jgi:hypothetical protein